MVINTDFQMEKAFFIAEATHGACGEERSEPNSPVVN